ncbi:MAG: DUF3467 domain-containing protein [Aquificales bacterium]|nr:DUF3467 domain-containing protein [Aquificales bacterium]
MSSESKHEEDDGAVLIPLSWPDVKDAPTIYANELFVTHSGNEFYLVFGEVPPLMVTAKEELPDFVEVNPVLKVAVSPGNMLRFAEVIDKNVKKFVDKLGPLHEEDK